MLYIKLIVIVCAWSIPSFLFANKNENPALNWSEEKNMHAAYFANVSSVVSVTNKYGSITIENWDKDSVSFDISIVAQAKEAQHAKALLQMAEIEFNVVGNQIEANLIWGKELNSVKRGAVDMMLSVKKDQRIDINYNIKVPKGIGIKIENRFGNVSLPEVEGKCFIEINHGDLRCNAMNDGRSISVKYGNVDIRKLKVANFDLAFSDLSVDAAEDITLKSSNSSIFIEKIDRLSIKSSNDKMNIEEVKKITGSSTLSNIRIRNLLHSINLTCRFGDLNVRAVASSFSSIQINGSYTDILLAFQSNSIFAYTVNLENGKSFNAPLSAGNFEETSIGKSKSYAGHFGKHAEKKIVIDLKSSDVRFESAL